MKRIGIMAATLGAAFLLGACDVVEGIFKAGMGVGILLVILVAALIFWLIGKMRK